jgi:hypothetical protein
MEDSIREITSEVGFLQGDGLALWAYIMTVHPFLRALKEHACNAGQLVDFVEESAVFIDRSMR